ncbi:MAG: hypothetical protein DWQ42_03335 [Planctomycetota bacterium]|nr:MAG: hypothetical protein DWQ42_03335 [Planctomycetota bacterium]REK47883.1 MAG: hypothetical protein DWQ46_03025 [Planctomycetota bacterium]
MSSRWSGQFWPLFRRQLWRWYWNTWNSLSLVFVLLVLFWCAILEEQFFSKFCGWEYNLWWVTGLGGIAFIVIDSLWHRCRLTYRD